MPTMSSLLHLESLVDSWREGGHACFHVPRGRSCATAVSSSALSVAAPQQQEASGRVLRSSSSGVAAQQAGGAAAPLIRHASHVTHASDLLCQYYTAELEKAVASYAADDILRFGYAKPGCHAA